MLTFHAEIELARFRVVDKVTGRQVAEVTGWDALMSALRLLGFGGRYQGQNIGAIDFTRVAV